MFERKTAVVIGATAASCLLAGLAIGTVADLSDPEESVDVISISDSPAPAGTRSPLTGQGTSRQVTSLDEVNGIPRYESEARPDVDDLMVGQVELEFGPDRWIEGAGPMEDYDRDGSAEPLREELAGLVGADASFLVRLDDDRDEGTVYIINDLTYRDPTRPAPWLEAAAGDQVATEDEIMQAAARAVGPGAVVTELEANDGGPAAWEAEVTDAQGAEYDVDLDVAGNALSVTSD